MAILRSIFSKFSGNKTTIRYIRKRVLLAGKEYSIKLQKGERNSCKKVDGTTLEFTLKEMTRENFSAYFDGWYRREARKLFKASLMRQHNAMTRLGYSVPTPTIKLYNMTRAWGRCYYTKEVVTLNLHLAKTPIECIDCIVLHELCHFCIQSHSKDFYAIMTNVDPDWKQKEQRLKTFALSNKIFSTH